jgi:hypothetical protein
MVAIAVVIVVDFGREHPTIFPMAESEESLANYTTIPEGTQIVARALGIPLEELIFGDFANGNRHGEAPKA